MHEKLSVLVRVDLECAQAQVAARGHVTVHNVQALYVVVKRANALLDGLVTEVDVSHAKVDPVALKQLRESSRSHHLPERIDPLQAECRFSVVAPDESPSLAASMRLAA
ncbi:MAG: hypothetical protein JWM01_1656 [Arthrobacter sp.]|jgi:hypothetical protein|nr:hypothetical protein [Arthrobacter sp.]MCU1540709.1 hypothetical protein [Arthrobacter sp.]